MVVPSVRITGSLITLAFFFVAGAALAADKLNPPLVNWTAPATFSPHSASRGASTMSDITFPLPFVSVTPCRQYDSRNSTPLPQNTSRAVTLTGAPCGLPTSAAAVSVNITIFNINGATSNGVFQVGTATGPTFAWINFPSTETQRGNAGALPLSGANQLWVRVEMGAGSLDFTVDVNGYYTDSMNANEAFNQRGNAGGGIVFGENASSGASPVSGVRGHLDATGTGLNAAGVFGEALATTGKVHGVFGKTSSNVNDNSGVYGRDSTALAPVVNVIGVSGVRGEGENGVIGLSSTNISEFGGVTGLMLNSTGNLGAFGSLGESFTTAVFGLGNLSVSGTKSFAEPHPTDPSKMIDYVALEGPEAGTYFRGTAYVSGGSYVINVPEDFRMVTDPEGLTVQLTPIGAPAKMYVVSEDLNQIVVNSDQDVKFHYMVNGVRASFKDHRPIVENTVFNPRSPTQRLSGALADMQRQRLIANGTYNSDGTVNLDTARAMGWTEAWEERARQVEQPSGAPDPQVRH